MLDLLGALLLLIMQPNSALDRLNSFLELELAFLRLKFELLEQTVGRFLPIVICALLCILRAEQLNSFVHLP